MRPFSNLLFLLEGLLSFPVIFAAPHHSLPHADGVPSSFSLDLPTNSAPRNRQALEDLGRGETDFASLDGIPRHRFDDQDERGTDTWTWDFDAEGSAPWESSLKVWEDENDDQDDDEEKNEMLSSTTTEDWDKQLWSPPHFPPPRSGDDGPGIPFHLLELSSDSRLGFAGRAAVRAGGRAIRYKYRSGRRNPYSGIINSPNRRRRPRKQRKDQRPQRIPAPPPPPRPVVEASSAATTTDRTTFPAGSSDEPPYSSLLPAGSVASSSLSPEATSALSELASAHRSELRSLNIKFLDELRAVKSKHAAVISEILGGSPVVVGDRRPAIHDLDDLGELRQRQLAFYSRFMEVELAEVDSRQKRELEVVKRRQREEWEEVRRRWGVRLLGEEEENEEEVKEEEEE